MLFGLNLTSKVVLGFAAGVVIGACGYKLISEKKINPKALEKTVIDLANKFKKTETGNEQVEEVSSAKEQNA